MFSYSNSFYQFITLKRWGNYRVTRFFINNLLVLDFSVLTYFCFEQLGWEILGPTVCSREVVSETFLLAFYSIPDLTVIHFRRKNSLLDTSVCVLLKLFTFGR